MTPTVIIACPDYAEKTVLKRMTDLLEPLGGMGNFIRAGERVLLKPNMLSASTTERCVTTHPEVVRAAARLVLDSGGIPFIGDSPGLDGFRSVAARTGMDQVAQELSIEIRELDCPVPLAMAAGSVFQKVSVSSHAVEADKIINLPKLKTHAQMMLTLGVKNLFGTVVRKAKAEWHYNVGLHRDTFSDLHLDIAKSLAPELTILDGIDGMEGPGPGNGRPRHFGLLAASRDPLDLDLRICTMLGADLHSFPLYRSALRRNLLPDLKKPAEGDFPSEFVFENVDIPRLDSLHLLPSFLDGFGKRFFTSRPVQDLNSCIRCGKCASICPADAMKLEENGIITIDYDKCIRCYCCQEVCPVDAISFSRGLVLRTLEFLKI